MAKRLILAALAAVVAAALVVFLLLPTIFPANALSLPYSKGLSASYAYGSCSYYQFKLEKPALITGSFVTSGSVTFYIASGPLSIPGGGGCLSVPVNLYSTGNVRQSSVNLALAPGTYVAGFVFVNQTSGQTWLNITKGFVASYLPTFVSQGPNCVSLSCHRAGQAPQGPGGTS